jgi:hypothetical protein
MIRLLCRWLRSSLLSMCMLLCVLFGLPVMAHDSINPEFRKNYLAKLQVTQQAYSANASAKERAKAQYQLGVTLIEIRDLFNQDIISHGIVKGLESTLLLSELNQAGFKPEKSPKTGLYLSHLHYFRDAIKLDPKASFADHARYLLLKNHFYDSFSDNPLNPISQSNDDLTEMLRTAESLLTSKDPAVSAEEVRFILAIHCLQAIKQKLLSQEDGMKKFNKLLQELRKEYPQSLKPLTLEALSP